MKKIILVVVMMILFLSCDPMRTIPEPDSPIIGTWSRGTSSFTFYNDGDFMYYHNVTGVLYNYGFFVEMSGGVLYIEDSDNDVYVYYWYEVQGDSLWLWLDSYVERVEYLRE